MITEELTLVRKCLFLIKWMLYCSENCSKSRECKFTAPWLTSRAANGVFCYLIGLEKYDWVTKCLENPFSYTNFLLNHKNILILGCGWWLSMPCNLQQKQWGSRNTPRMIWWLIPWLCWGVIREFTGECLHSECLKVSNRILRKSFSTSELLFRPITGAWQLDLG